MLALLAGLGAAAAATATSGDVADLQRLWSGVRDSSEQVVVGADERSAAWPQLNERRVRTLAAAVAVPWLGEHVLYLEEFLEDDPGAPRRQLLLQLQSADAATHTVRAQLFTFAEPRRWLHLNYRPALLAQLASRDLVPAPGCELLLRREGDQFRGGTQGRHCAAAGRAAPHYLDYQLVIGEGLYWYRRRLLRSSDGQLREEVIGYDRFEPNAARLYACRVAWSASGVARDLQPLVTLDLYEEGGHAQFTTPDGRTLELRLHGRDWPFAVDRDALLLLLQDALRAAPLATAWAHRDAQRIELRLSWIRVRCGAIAPDSEELAQ